MARATFGGTTADTVARRVKVLGHDVDDYEAATLTVWSAQTGGTQYTDLLVNGAASNSVPVDSTGQVPEFQGPDGVTIVWVSAGGARVKMLPAEGPTDTSVAGYVNDSASSTRAALDGAISVQVDSLANGVVIPKPSGFPAFRRTFNVLRLGSRLAKTDYDPAPDRPPAGVTYYASPTGAYGAAGTLADPCSPRGAHDKADVGTIVLLDGTYWATSTLGQLGKSVNIVAQNAAAKTSTGLPRPSVIMTGYINPATLTWTLQAGSIYQTTTEASSVELVNDIRTELATTWGDAPIYTKVADLASITAPGQWALVDTTLYVWALGSANLATNSSFIRVAQNANNGHDFSGIQSTTTGVRVYVEGVEFQGCGFGSANYSSVRVGSGGVLVMKDCRVRYSSYGGINVLSDEWSALLNVEVSSCQGDAIGYDPTGWTGNVLQALEVDCYAHHCAAADTSDVTINASTSHAGAQVIRVQTKGDHTHGPIFADVTGATSWNIACEGRAATSATNNVGFQILGGNMWCDACDASGNDIGYEPGTDGFLYYRNLGPGGNTNEVLPIGNGVAASY